MSKDDGDEETSFLPGYGVFQQPHIDRSNQEVTFSVILVHSA
jgi:hypothetical protein